jgi:uncharacterized lipoprotein NlpE involved in copper resistance
MDIEKLKYEAQNKALHIADVSGSALFNADSDPEKHEQAKREAYGYITRAIEAAE